MEDTKKIILFSTLTSNSDIFLTMGVVGILIIMIIPIHPNLMDVLFAFNITLSLIVLMISMYTIKPLDFSVFPSLLLILTLFRLSLNIGSTRLILIHGNESSSAAGEIIKAFGSFVVGGNYVVGLVIFFILVIINFVVITKGAGRIAEVAARFTLDAMPGKQMSIDADLNAGLINEAEARQRRSLISKEADFYGAMDGASKFVRGDAIAGILITLINIVGGLGIGTLQKGMTIMKATQNYTLLTVGDGLVSQIPALVISTSAGIIVTRAASESNLGRDVTLQLLVHPRAIFIVSIILMILALTPGLPTTPFFVLSAISSGLAFVILKTKEQDVSSVEEKPADEREESKIEILPPLDILELEISYNLIPLVDIEGKGDLLDRIKNIRQQFALDMGLIIPPIHIRDNLQLKPNQYSILLKGNEVAKGEVMVDHTLAMNPGSIKEEIIGIATTEPAFGLPAIWIKDEDKDRAQVLGYTLADPSTVIVTHLMEIIKNHAYELLGRQEVQQLIDKIKETHPKVVEELIPGILTLGDAHKVLQNLLKEQIPIRDLLTIFEALADWAPFTKDTLVLTEYVRQALSRTITKLYQSPDGTISVVNLDQKLEDDLTKTIQHTDQGSYLAVEPNFIRKILTKLNQVLESFSPIESQPVILCSPVLRPHFKGLINRFIQSVIVLSPNEITPEIQIKSIGILKIE
ncbi:MAG: flagellar biosynthesis protein FlhA [Thermodesulfobacteriota bacterium]|nr:flagellar biosynthesis protein FlhA [Thermodesulfobacteriota bacterium]